MKQLLPGWEEPGQMPGTIARPRLRTMCETTPQKSLTFFIEIVAYVACVTYVASHDNCIVLFLTRSSPFIWMFYFLTLRGVEDIQKCVIWTSQVGHRNKSLVKGSATYYRSGELRPPDVEDDFKMFWSRFHVEHFYLLLSLTDRGCSKMCVKHDVLSSQTLLNSYVGLISNQENY